MRRSRPTRREWFASPLLAAPLLVAQAGPVLPLEMVRRDALAYCAEMRDQAGPYGCYRGGPRKRSDLYSSCDIAILRAVMGEDLVKTLDPADRRQWIEHINSYVDRSMTPPDGSYSDTYGHSKLHANGMVVSALGALGGRQALPVRLYEDFDTSHKVGSWLESVNWAQQWRASHLFWGGMLCFSHSRRCSPGWLDTVFSWLDRNLDPRTGWWRKGVPYADRHQPLGGSVHILPLYQHHHRRFPYPDRIIDSVLQLQLPSGRWMQTTNPHVMHYLELDALYALALMRSFAPGYREKEIQGAVARYGHLVCQYYREAAPDLYRLHPHLVLSAIGTFGLLSRLAPAMFPADGAWSDIFSDPRFHRTAAVEADASVSR